MDFKLSHQKSTTFGIVHSLLMKLHVKVRSSHFFSCMAIRKDRHVVSPVGAQFEGNNDIGVFSKLTNKYCLVCTGGSENFYGAFETELADQIPVIHSSIAGCRFVGRVTAGRLHSRSFYVRKQEWASSSSVYNRQRVATAPQFPSRWSCDSTHRRASIFSWQLDCLQRSCGASSLRLGSCRQCGRAFICRRRRRLCPMCSVWRCSDNRLLEMLWLVATASSPTKEV